MTFQLARILSVLPLAFAVFLSTTPAFASGGQCYSPDELKAEQWLRLHSELMVLTVTCKVGSQGEDLVIAYTGFTRNNIQVLHNAEQTIVRYYRGQGVDGIAQLDKMRTELGNEYGQKIADISAQSFCDQGRDKVLKFYRMQGNDVATEVAHMTIAEHSYHQLCTPGATVAGKGQ